MLESGSSGSVRGVLSNEHPYREPGSLADLVLLICDVRFSPLSGRSSVLLSRPKWAFPFKKTRKFCVRTRPPVRILFAPEN